MIEPSKLDIAELKFEMHQMCQHLSFDGQLQVLYEMLCGADIFAEVIMEERINNEKTN